MVTIQNAINFFTNQSNTRKLELDTSTITLTYNGDIPGEWVLNGENLELDPGTSLINIEGVMRTQNGDILNYNNVNFFGISASMSTTNVYAYYNHVEFFSLIGMVDGTCYMTQLY